MPDLHSFCLVLSATSLDEGIHLPQVAYVLLLYANSAAMQIRHSWLEYSV